MLPRNLLLSGAAIVLTAGQAAAALTASATTDLNLRAGPGPQHEILGVIGGDDEVEVEGCLDSTEWCRVTHDGTTGWAYSAYLTTPVEGEPRVIYENATELEVDTVTYRTEGSTADAVGGAAWGAAAGALLVGGPAAAAAGAILGAAAGGNAEVEERTVTYIRENPVEPVYLDGEVAVGAGIPETVTIHEVPESDFAYLNVNRQVVVVDPGNRRIIRVIR